MDEQSRDGKKEEDLRDGERPNDATILAELLHILGPLNDGLPLSELREKLPSRLAELGRNDDVVRTWLQRYPQILQVIGSKGQERVMLNLAKGPAPQPQQPQPTQPPAVHQQVPTPPGPIGAEDRVPNGNFYGTPAIVGGNAIVGDDDSSNPSSVQLRGLPFKATVEDVQRFLGEHAKELNPEKSPNICLLANREGRPSGFARVFFVSPQAAHKCKDALHKKQMGDRYVEVLAIDRHGKGRKKAEELREYAIANAPPMDAASEQVEKERILHECREHLSVPGRHQTLLSMLGIALSEPARNYLRRANLGLKHFLARFPNEFRVEGPKGCEKVVWLSSDMEHANMQIYGISENGWTVPENLQEPSTPDTRLLSPTRPPPSGGHFIATPSDWGTPQATSGALGMDFPFPGWPSYNFAPFNSMPWMPWDTNGTSAGSSKQKKTKAPHAAHAAHGALEGAPAIMSRSHAHLHPQSHPFAEETDVKDAPEDKTGVAALRLRGLPFSVTVQDVLTFFAQHNVADTIHDGPNSAKLLPKANGRPSGQAVVQMRTRKDAEVAQKALHNQHVGGRYIEVFVYGNAEGDKEDETGPRADSSWSEWPNSYSNAAPWSVQWANMPPAFNTEEAKDGWDALIMQAMLPSLPPTFPPVPEGPSRPTLQVWEKVRQCQTQQVWVQGRAQPLPEVEVYNAASIRHTMISIDIVSAY